LFNKCQTPEIGVIEAGIIASAELKTQAEIGDTHEAELATR
jgi:hypothetical protein